ncbi:L-mandelate dehydrogenase, partial [Dioszegia hungarica]
GSPGTVSRKELERHFSKEDIWVAIDGEVWDVTDFVGQHPGGSQVLIDHAGKDVTTLFKGIHPVGTLQSNLREDQRMGTLDTEAVQYYANLQGDEDSRIEQARASLIGVDSIITLDDFEKHARPLLQTSAWNYFSFGADGEHTMRNNSDAYQRVWFRPRVLRDVTECDMSTEVLGVKSEMPVYISPTARNGLGQPLGEIAATQGAAASGVLQVLSHVASRSLTEVMQARANGQEIGWQIYMDPDRSKAEAQIREAVKLGVHSIWLTVDRQAVCTLRSRKILYVGRLTEDRGHSLTPQAAHDSPLTREMPRVISPRHDTNLTWKDVGWIKSLAPGLPVVVKGIGAWEDVILAKENGADAVVLTNHGGRQLNFAHAPLQTLHELHQNAPHMLHRDDFQVFVDGGIRHGTDVLKALCLGANAVGLGRPIIYALTGWGSDGVDRAFMILKHEMEVGMRSLGVTRLDQLGPEYLDCKKL